MHKWILSLLLMLAVSGQAMAQSMTLLTTDDNDSYGEEVGLFFDLTAINDVSIESFGLYSNSDEGETVTVDFYTRPGSYVGFDSSPTGWTLIASVTINHDGTYDENQFVLPELFGMSAGETMGMYAYSPVGGISHDDTTGPATWSDANLSLTNDFGSEYGAFSGDNDTSMNFAGSVTYVEGLPFVPATSVPTLSGYGLLLAALGMLLLGRRRLYALTNRG